jgi:hypothetical protein
VARCAACLCLGSALLAQPAEIHEPPGTYRTSWVGNSFPGDGGPNGFGYWVQNSAQKMAVAADGTVIAGTEWDEAGRCVGLYKDGKVNRVLVKHENAQDTAWGWNTGNSALAVDGANIFVANAGRRLLHFTWTPGDLDSVKFADEQEMPAKALGLSAKAGRLALVYTNKVELRKAVGFSLLTNFDVADAQDVTFAPDDSLWVIAGTKVLHFTDAGRMLFAGLPGVVKPAALAFDQARLIVCDDGPDQQVRFFDVSGAEPKLVSTFGDQGGLRSGRPGESAPGKLYALRGAGKDMNGNLYVAMGFSGAPVGTLTLRSFSPDGTWRWELASHAFVDTFGFDPEADGSVIYSRTGIFILDIDSGQTNSIWRQRATTVDAVKHPEDPRANSGMTVYLRHLQGRELLYGIGQYGGGYRLFAPEEPNSYLAQPLGSITAPGETWAWDVAANGDIWHGDAPERTIRRHVFRGWGVDGQPRFETNQTDCWPWPQDFGNVRRIMYQQESDTLYLSGYLNGEDIDSWGVTGKTLRRYDGWTKGEKKERWTIKLPLNPKGADNGKDLSPNSLAVAGDYMFVGMVKPENGKQPVHILKLADGSYVGTLTPGPEVGGNAGWEDMPYAVAALQRKNGEYLILVEEDWRGKNLLYRWKPPEVARAVRK